MPREPLVEFEVDERSLREVSEALSRLPRKLARRTARASLRRWGNLVARTMKSLAPRSARPYRRRTPSGVVHERGGELRRGIKVKVRTYRNGTVWVGVGVRHVRGQYVPAGWRVHFSEFGAFNTRAKRRLPGRRFMRLALRLHGPALPAMVASDVAAVVKESRT